MELLWHELKAGIPDLNELLRIVIRLTAAVLLAGVIGYFREVDEKPAGLRTHILVSLGTAGFVIAAVSYGMHEDALSRVVQGIVTGIGFIGAGSVLKLRNEVEIKGLTTAAGIWTTCAIGVMAGLGQIGAAAIGTLLAVVVLRGFLSLEERLGTKADD